MSRHRLEQKGYSGYSDHAPGIGVSQISHFAGAGIAQSPNTKAEAIIAELTPPNLQSDVEHMANPTETPLPLVAGQVIEVVVERVEVYGAFCRYQTREVLLLIPETSWVASYCSCQQFTSPGDRHTVKVLRVSPTTGEVSVTLMGLHPNPWENGALTPGQEHLARVVRHVANSDRCGGGPGFLLELVPGGFVMTPDAGQAWQPSQQVRVVVQESDAFKRSVSITPLE